MYEDRKSKKKLRVRWFHKTEELVGPVPPPTPHPKEVFMTPFPQVLSVECVDGLATVLTPEHYVRCVTFSVDAHICFRQFDNEGVKPFTISNVEGYWHQKVLALFESTLPRELSPNSEPTSDSMEIDEDEEADVGCIIRRRRSTVRYSKRQICIANQITSGCIGTVPFTFQPSNRLVSSGTSDSESKRVPGEMCSPASINTTSRDQVLQAFDVGDKVELLCQDSGIRGCWYRCTVLGRIPSHLKVCYEELEAEDGHGKLEEWIPCVKLALPDRLGIRIPRRPAIRPLSSALLVSENCEIGSLVDAWWNDGWWEGVVLSKKVTEILVYFPDENDYATLQPSDLRVSREWINGQWVDVKSSIQVMKTISSMLSVSSIPCLALDRVGFCLQQTSAVSHNVPTLVTEICVLPEHLERAAGCATPSEAESKDAGPQKESNYVSSKDDHPLAMTSEVKAYVDTKKESPGALFKEQNMQLIELGGRGDSASIHQEHEPLNALKGTGTHTHELKQISSKKRPYQLDVANVLRNVKSGILIPGAEIRDTREEIMAEQERWTGKGEACLACLEALKENGMYEQVIGAEEVVKMKKSRTVHETLKPLQGPTMGNPLFINSAPLAGLVMSR